MLAKLVATTWHLTPFFTFAIQNSIPKLNCLHFSDYSNFLNQSFLSNIGLLNMFIGFTLRLFKFSCFFVVTPWQFLCKIGKNSTIGLKVGSGPYVLVKDHIYVLVEGLAYVLVKEPILPTLVERIIACNSCWCT